MATTSTPMANRYGAESRAAPWYGIPSHSLVSVEHPCVVKDVDKAIDMLHGGEQISKVIAAPSSQDTPISLKFNPDDCMSKTILSASKKANNVLLKITVPKRTGRKRKRGSQEPYRMHDGDDVQMQDTAGVERHDVGVGSQEIGLDARGLLRRLKDNVRRYHVEAVGKIERNHVFRAMPDFVFSTAASPFVAKIREQILPFEYPKMKQFQLDPGKGLPSSGRDLIPPPSLSNIDVPFSYFYRQNPNVKHLVDDTTGESKIVNTQKVTRVLTHLVACDIPVVPSAPSPGCPPIHTLDKQLQALIAKVESLFQQRKGWTRRALRNNLPTRREKYQLRSAVPYVGYIFRSGPWRDCVLKLGYDPRTHPESRIYQTLMFRLMPGATLPDVGGPDGNGAAWTKPGTVSTSHLFTGQPPIYTDAKSWMVCDITDPFLVEHIFSLPPMETCDISISGWYGNVTLALARAIMRAKIQFMLENENAVFPREWEEEMLPMLRLPRHVDSEAEIGLLTIADNPRCVMLSLEVRGTLRSAPGRVGYWKRVGRREDSEDDDDEEDGERGGEGDVEGEREGEGEERASKRVRWKDEEQVYGDDDETETETETETEAEDEEEFTGNVMEFDGREGEEM